MTINWHSKLRHLLQTWAFCAAVALVQQGFMPDHQYLVTLVYSLLIGSTTWAVIDLGRHALPSAAETGWPTGLSAVLLVAGGIVAGFFFGRLVADALCRTFHLYAGPPPMRPGDEFRVGALITLLAGIAGSYWFYSRHRGEYLLGKMREATRHASEARLKLLETQLEPHMLFNTLANLRALIAVDPERAQQMLDHMIAYLRATLDASRATTHPLRTEFERLRDYLELMAIRMGPRLSYALELPPELEQVRVPALLLQPLVENSIKHGLEPKVSGGRIDVRAWREGGGVGVEVVDTGAGDTAAGSASAGFGLAHIRERLQSLYGDRAQLDFACDAQGAHARITLPVA
jgi:two-component sensor histidine kinase